MNWTIIGDYMNAFLGSVVILLGLIFIPEIRTKKRYWISVIIIAVLLFWIGCSKVKRDSTEKEMNDAKVDSLTNNIKDIQKTNSALLAKQERDSLKNVEFQDELFKQFKIIRDSALNKPIQTQYNFNTNIKKADKVHIGPGND